MLRERLNPSQVMSLHTVDSPDSAGDEAPHSEALRQDECDEDERVEDEAISDDTEYVDDPQIDLLSA
jgi:hypothetical protein